MKILWWTLCMPLSPTSSVVLFPMEKRSLEKLTLQWLYINSLVMVCWKAFESVWGDFPTEWDTKSFQLGIPSFKLDQSLPQERRIWKKYPKSSAKDQLTENATGLAIPRFSSVQVRRLQVLHLKWMEINFIEKFSENFKCFTILFLYHARLLGLLGRASWWYCHQIGKISSRGLPWPHA